MKGQASLILFALWEEMDRRKALIEAVDDLSSVTFIVNLGRDGRPGRVLFRTESASPAAEPRPKLPSPPPTTPR